MKKNKTKKNLFDLSEKEQERIMKMAIKKASKDQMDLVKRYDKKFGKAKAGSGC